jgi:hypothetical protein
MRNLNGCIYNYDSSFVICSQLLDRGVTNTLQNLQVLWSVSKGTAILCIQYCSIFSHHELHMACISNTSLYIPIEN